MFNVLISKQTFIFGIRLKCTNQPLIQFIISIHKVIQLLTQKDRVKYSIVYSNIFLGGTLYT